MELNQNPSEPNAARNGILLAIFAYTFWGLFPIYIKMIAHVAPAEVVMHRILWSVPFGAIIIGLRAQWPAVRSALKDSKTRNWLTLSALFIGLNWGVYVWAVQIDQIMQASLGYYINPLMYVLVGVVFLKEALNKIQIGAVVLAVIGVMYLTVQGGQFPIISIVLAISFTIYGVVRKQVNVGGMPGLFVETLLLVPFAAIYLMWVAQQGNAAFTPSDMPTMGLLLLAGPFTVLPLLAFALAARRLNLSTIAFLQFIGPTIQFIVAIMYGEPLDNDRLICFFFIWSAVIVFCIGAAQKQRRSKTPI